MTATTKLLLIAGATILAIGVALFAVRTQPVLYSYVEAGNPIKEPVFAIFNPFRDRDPERKAREFLQRLKDGGCEEVMSALEYEVQYGKETCEHERTNSLMSWKMGNRTDEPQRVRLFYRVRRKQSPNISGQVWLTVEKQSNGWHVTRYDRYY